MTTERSAQANRINARASTGPRTATGKSRASRNALRHGLSMPVLLDPVWSKGIKALARKIAGDDANAERYELAAGVAAAHFDLMRVRHARHHMVSQALRDPIFREMTPTLLALKWLREYEFGIFDPRPDSRFFETINTPGKYVRVMTGLAEKMTVMDRYERRARSRRKSAIRAFDATCADAFTEASANHTPRGP